MSKQKKFGAFGGVFTPSLLTILGVIMYMRLGWVVGHAGLIGAIVIVLVAHVISISTGLSVSSIATDKKVGAGGIYYILSRSMGIPIGGAIGIALYVGTAFSIALYLIGFAESFNEFFGFSTDINGLRLTGTMALISLTAIALISTSFALKTQFFILAAIVISLFSIFFGTTEYAPTTVDVFARDSTISMAAIFAIFFPAVTGFTAGIAMSGDLKDPKKSIPFGTLAAIAVGLIVYIGLAIFIAHTIDAGILQTDNNILKNMAFSPKAVVAGIWGATLSSALGGILGGPRILQAMSKDRVTHSFFGKGKGKNNEPINALILVFVIAQLGILIGELDMIARVVSMFYLAAYGFINISFFLESWANADFRPTFRVNRWFGLVGALACFGVMFQLDIMFMFAAFIVIGSLYYWLKRKHIELESNDVWQSVWNTIVAKGLKTLETQEQKQKQWNPNVILFSGNTQQRPYLINFSKLVSGKSGLITNFNLIPPQDSTVPQSKTDQIIKDTDLEKLGIFGRQIVVDDIYQGIENIATTFGFSGVEPNTVLLGWAKNSQNPSAYARMTQKLIDLDYNILYLDYDEERGLGQHNTIDLWWRDAHNNAELMLNICRFIKQSNNWTQAKIRILFVNQNNADSSIVKLGINQLLEKVRTEAEVKIINNGVDQKPIYKIIEQYSQKTDLVLLGIPNVEEDKQSLYIEKTNHLFEAIGTTLLVKASQDFNALDLDFTVNVKTENPKQDITPLKRSKHPRIQEEMLKIDALLSQTSEKLNTDGLALMSSFHNKYLQQIEEAFESMISQIKAATNKEDIFDFIDIYYDKNLEITTQFCQKNILIIKKRLDESIKNLWSARQNTLDNLEKKILLSDSSHKTTIKWRALIKHYWQYYINDNINHNLGEFVRQNYNILYGYREHTVQLLTRYIAAILSAQMTDNATNILHLEGKDFLKSMHKDAQLLGTSVFHNIQLYERNICNQIINDIDQGKTSINIQLKNLPPTIGKPLDIENNIRDFGDNFAYYQNLFGAQNKTAFHLGKASNILSKNHNSIKEHVINDIFKPQIQYIDQTKKILENTPLTEHKPKGIFLNQTNIYSRFNATNFLVNEEEKVINIATLAPQHIELLTQDALRHISENTGYPRDTFILELAKIENYIIKTNYTYPLQNLMQNLEYKDKKNEESLTHLSFMIKHLYDQKEEKSDNFAIELEEINRLIDSKYEDLREQQLRFEEQLALNLSQTIIELNIKSILDSIDILNQNANANDYSSQLTLWFKAQHKKIKETSYKIRKALQDEAHQIDIAQKHAQDKQLENPLEKAAQLMLRIEPSKEVIAHSSMYYIKLFSGSHLSTHINGTWKNQLTAAHLFKNMHQMSKSGALVILGPSQIGKTYFSRAIATDLFQNEIIRIQAPSNLTLKKSDLHQSFEKALNKEGKPETLLKQLSKPKTFILNDLEKWWIHTQNGDILINYLVEIIENFGNKHVFILNMHEQSYNNICTTTQIENVLLSTIRLDTVSREAIGKIILKRHNGADGHLKYKDQNVETFDKNHPYFKELLLTSEGRIGVALTQWLANINCDENHQFTLNLPIKHSDIQIIDPMWKLVLTQLIIHNIMSEIHIKHIFPQNMFGQILNTLKKMEKSGWVSCHNNTHFSLDKRVKFYVEKIISTQNKID